MGLAYAMDDRKRVVTTAIDAGLTHHQAGAVLCSSFHGWQLA
jgi:hypothetical protein